MNFDKVKELCKKRHITIQQLEKDIGISRGAAYKWKTSSPSATVIAKVAKYFDVPIDYFLDSEAEGISDNFTIDIDSLEGKRKEFAENIKSIYLSGVADEETFEVISKIIMNDWEFLQHLKNK